MPSRRRFADKDRVRIFTVNDGVCHLCGHKIDGVREKWEVEHVIAWELTRDDSDDNLRPAHVDCHKDKTHKQDRPAIREAQRREARHTGAHRPKQPFPRRPKAPKPEPKPSLPPAPIYTTVGAQARNAARTMLWPAGQSEGD